MSCATYNTPTRSGLARLRSGLLIAGQAVLLITLAGLTYAWVLVAAVLIETPPPTERCFDSALAETDYCRTQRYWGAE